MKNNIKSEKLDFEKIDKEIINTEFKDIIKDIPEIFNIENRINTCAYLNWRFEPYDKTENQFFNMAEGYFETAICLLRECINDVHSKKSDIWIFPILFNIIHGIEIYLKGFNSLYTILKNLASYQENKNTKIEGAHDIKQLCETAIAKIRATGKKDENDKSILEGMNFILCFINMIYDKTDDMAFCRYPLNKKNKQKQFYVSNDNITIELYYFYIWVVKVFNTLSNICDYIYYEVGEIEDYLREEAYYESLEYYDYY